MRTCQLFFWLSQPTWAWAAFVMSLPFWKHAITPGELGSIVRDNKNMAKLTLTVDKSIASRAKHYCKQRGVSVSKLGKEYLDLISTPLAATDGPPIKSADTAKYRKYLIKKHNPVQLGPRV